MHVFMCVFGCSCGSVTKKQLVFLRPKKMSNYINFRKDDTRFQTVKDGILFNIVANMTLLALHLIHHSKPISRNPTKMHALSETLTIKKLRQLLGTRKQRLSYLNNVKVRRYTNPLT